MFGSSGCALARRACPLTVGRYNCDSVSIDRPLIHCSAALTASMPSGPPAHRLTRNRLTMVSPNASALPNEPRTATTVAMLPHTPADAPRAPVRLTDLRRGERARLHATATGLDVHDSELLRAMGLIGQCELRVCRCGEPCIVQVNTTRLGVSANVARCILVERA